MRAITPNTVDALAAVVRLPRRRALAGMVGAATAATLAARASDWPHVARADNDPMALRDADWDVPGGHFYTQGAPENAPPDTGYVISDADGMPFWRDYTQLGGPWQLGFPVSERYAFDGAIYQAMQAGILRWNPGAGRAEVYPVFAVLAESNWDDWLEEHGVPRTAPELIGTSGLAPEARISWLTHPDLRAAYMAVDDDQAIGTPEVERFGWPMGAPERFGPYIAQRFEKAVLQVWLDDLPGQPSPGDVSMIQVGDLLAAADVIPRAARSPQSAPAPRPDALTSSAAPAPLAFSGSAAPSPAPGKYIVVSLGKQAWYAYQDGQQLNSGPVTTGRPELPTPRGRFSVLGRHSPFTFVSPWGRGSPYWYAPSPATYAVRITNNGIFLHDAPWRPFYGAGTNVPHTDPDGVWRTGSHGCINMPFAAAQWLYNFAPVGTTVDVTV